MLRDERGETEYMLCGQLGYRVGAGPDVDIRIHDEPVAELHCVLTREPDGRLLVTDCGSRSGTRVNGVRRTMAYLADGDELRVGDTTLIAYCVRSMRLRS